MKQHARYRIQSNLLEADTLGTRKSVRLREVSDYGILKMHVWLGVCLREVSVSGGWAVLNKQYQAEAAQLFSFGRQHNRVSYFDLKFEPRTTQQLSFE